MSSVKPQITEREVRSVLREHFARPIRDLNPIHSGQIAQTLYGDFVYDIAWLDLWSPHYDFQELFRQYYARKDVPVPCYAERVLCYRCSISLDALRFFAKLRKKDAYLWVRERILSFLGDR